MFLDVPGIVLGMDALERMKVALRIERARIEMGLSKEAAAKDAGVSTTTWRRAEQGLRLHDHKLDMILKSVGLTLDGSAVAEERWPTHQWSPSLFVMPPEVEFGYTATVKFVKAVQEYAPPLSNRATRLMIDAASLFADAGDYLLTLEGGDGHADDSARGAAPIEAVAAHDEDHTIEEEQESDEFP